MANPFYDPWSIYGGTNPYTGNAQDWYNSPLVTTDMSNSLPQGEFERFLTQQGYGGTDNRAGFGRQTYGRTQAGYQAAELSNPNLSYRDYLGGLGPGWLDQMYAALTPEDRGQSMPGQTRVVRWG